MAMWAEGTFRSVMLPGHEDAVCSLAFRGSLLASGSRDCTARLWAVRDTSGAPEAVLKHVLAHPNLVTCVALNSEASVLSSGCYDQLIRLWSTESGECTKVLTGHSGTVWAAQWSAAAPRPSQRRCSPLCSALPPPTPPLRPGGRAGPLLLSGAGYPECCAKLTRTPRGLRWVRTGYAYQPPALGTYRRRRAACPQGPTYSTYWVRVSFGRSVRTAYCGNPGLRAPAGRSASRWPRACRRPTAAAASSTRREGRTTRPSASTRGRRGGGGVRPRPGGGLAGPRSGGQTGPIGAAVWLLAAEVHPQP